jgi:hypothetical protein
LLHAGRVHAGTILLPPTDDKAISTHGSLEIIYNAKILKEKVL